MPVKYKCHFPVSPLTRKHVLLWRGHDRCPPFLVIVVEQYQYVTPLERQGWVVHPQAAELGVHLLDAEVPSWGRLVDHAHCCSGHTTEQACIIQYEHSLQQMFTVYSTTNLLYVCM